MGVTTLHSWAFPARVSDSAPSFDYLPGLLNRDRNPRFFLSSAQLRYCQLFTRIALEQGQERRIGVTPWKRLTLAPRDGGLGVADLSEFGPRLRKPLSRRDLRAAA